MSCFIPTVYTVCLANTHTMCICCKQCKLGVGFPDTLLSIWSSSNKLLITAFSTTVRVELNLVD